MYQTVNFNDFRDAFSGQYKNNFTYEGLQVLFDYLEELEDDLGESTELDVVAIASDYNEWSGLEEFQESYGDEYESLDAIQDTTTVIDMKGSSFITQVF